MYGNSLRRAAGLALAATLAASAAHAQTALQVDVDAAGTFDRSFDWSIEKSVTPENSDRFIGETQALDFTIAVTKGAEEDSGFEVSGSADIHNPGTSDATITGITIMYGASVVTHACSVGTLAGGATQVCNFSFNPTDATELTLSVDVATSGDIAGGSDSVEVDFAAPDVTNASVTVEDSNLVDPLVFNESGMHAYSQVVPCSADGNSVTIDNTATIVETQDSDTAHARIACHVVRIKERNGFADAGRLWIWEIDKKLPPELELPLMLAAGDSFDVDYTITVDAVSEVTADDTVTGNVKIVNTHPFVDGELNSVAVTIETVENSMTVATVDCGGPPPFLVPDSESVDSVVTDGMLTCTFEATVPAGETAEWMHVVVEQQLYDYAADGTPTANGVKVLSGTSAINQGGSGTETDECIDVSDAFDGAAPVFVDEVCADETPLDLQFTGTINVTAESECEFEVPNVASFLTNDTGTEGSDEVLVTVVRTDCGEAGCTRTQGYWKTHSIYGPAPYDDTWAVIGEDTAFFLSGLSWYEVMWTAPSGGNAYFQLAHQYIAAVLNMEAGASAPPEVLDAIEEATGLFETWTDEQIGALRGNNATRQQFNALAELLDSYNMGAIGPGHCEG